MRSHHWLMILVVAAVFYWVGAAYPAAAQRLGVA